MEASSKNVWGKENVLRKGNPLFCQFCSNDRTWLWNFQLRCAKLIKTQKLISDTSNRTFTFVRYPNVLSCSIWYALQNLVLHWNLSLFKVSFTHRCTSNKSHPKNLTSLFLLIFLSKHISLYALGRRKWILGIIWPLN